MSTTPEDPRDPNQPTGEPNYGAPSGGAGPDYGAPAGGAGPDYGSTPPPASPPPPYAAPGAPVPPAAPQYPQQPGYTENPYAPQAPQAPYGAPLPGGASPYGPAYGGPSELPPSKGMAITAMIFAFLVCIPILPIVAIVLAIIVLRRGKDGRNHGKGLAIGALIVAPVMLLATTALIVAIAVVASNYKSVNDLQATQCFNGLEGDRSFRNLEIVDCADPHDGQVLATVTLTASEASEYADNEDAGGALCAREIADVASMRAYLSQPELEPLLLTDREKPVGGDTLACVVHRTDGKKIEDSLENPSGEVSSGSGTGALG